MKILGVSAYYHDSAVALVVDGDIMAAAQEERAYLHAAGLYIPPLAAGEPATRLLVPPEEGEEFLTEAFKLWFSRQCSVDMLAPDVRTEST